jgi:hypothetical protein
MCYCTRRTQIAPRCAATTQHHSQRNILISRVINSPRRFITIQSRAQFYNCVDKENKTDLPFDVTLIKLAESPTPMLDVSG